jgi:hypothetical protein
MRATLFAVGCMALLGAAQFYDFKQLTCPTMCCPGSTFYPRWISSGKTVSMIDAPPSTWMI